MTTKHDNKNMTTNKKMTTNKNMTTIKHDNKTWQQAKHNNNS